MINLDSHSKKTEKVHTRRVDFLAGPQLSQKKKNAQFI